MTNNLTFTLQNQRVLLEPLSLVNYQTLVPIASQEKLVEYSPSDIATPEALRLYVETALEQHQLRQSIPYIVFDKKTETYAGCTRYMNISWRHKVIEIGSTWIGREFHGSGLNGSMKELMLNCAFHEMGFEKVSFRIDQRNIRSRKAVEKLGATLEGILRKNVYLLDGYKRNTCCYGLLREEWDNYE